MAELADKAEKTKVPVEVRVAPEDEGEPLIEIRAGLGRRYEIRVRPEGSERPVLIAVHL